MDYFNELMDGYTVPMAGIEQHCNLLANHPVLLIQHTVQHKEKFKAALEGFNLDSEDLQTRLNIDVVKQLEVHGKKCLDFLICRLSFK